MAENGQKWRVFYYWNWCISTNFGDFYIFFSPKRCARVSILKQKKIGPIGPFFTDLGQIYKKTEFYSQKWLKIAKSGGFFFIEMGVFRPILEIFTIFFAKKMP